MNKKEGEKVFDFSVTVSGIVNAKDIAEAIQKLPKVVSDEDVLVTSIEHKLNEGG